MRISFSEPRKNCWNCCCKGHLIVYCTARNRREAYSVIQRFHLPYDYLILNNGSQIEDRAGMELYNHPLSHDLGMEILRFCRNYLGYYLYFQGSGEKTDCGIRNELADCVAKRAEAYNMIGIKPYGKNAKLSKLVGIAGDIRQRYGAEVKVSLNTLSLAVTAKDDGYGEAAFFHGATPESVLHWGLLQ